MVKDIQNAIETYRALSPVEKRLFRAEVGLDSVKNRAVGGAKRKATAPRQPRAARKPKAAAATAAAPTAAPAPVEA